jgi:ribose-phosphate pyrophosphokinase
MMLISKAVIPYFPYSRQSKKKSHRGAITARMLANLLDVAGINHVITIDLHASQMQGFFKCPVDNLHAEPMIARWIRHNVPGWRDAVCVSKNAGGTKRVTSLADALKLNFGMVTTDRRRGGNMSASFIMSQLDRNSTPIDRKSTPRSQIVNGDDDAGNEADSEDDSNSLAAPSETTDPQLDGTASSTFGHDRQESTASSIRSARIPPFISTHSPNNSTSSQRGALSQSVTSPARPMVSEEDFEYTDERAREVIHGRLVHGHIVPDDYPSPTVSAMSNSMILDRQEIDHLEMSQASSYFAPEPHALGGTHDAAQSSDEEGEDPASHTLEQMITLVGDVRGRNVFIVDDMIDKAGTWIAAAETVVKRGGAKKVYCIATHGLFGGDSLEALQDCDCIDTIVVTSSFPISEEKLKACNKLVVLDLAPLLAEAIRRNHYGESISALFQHISD